MQFRRAQLVLTALITIYGHQMTAQSQAVGRPVAIDKLPSGSLYVLDAQGAVHAIDFPGGKPAVTGSFHFPPGWAASDLVSAQRSSQNILFCAYNVGLTGEVILFSPTGSQLKWWRFQNGVAGITYDSSNSILYVASGRTSEIFRINLSIGSGQEFFAEIPGSQRLGPILFDSKDNSLFVGDYVMGVIYKLDIVRRRATVLFGGLGRPSAMKLSEDQSSLFVADERDRKVVIYSIAQSSSVPKTFAKIPQFRSPSGLALIDGGLAVSDDAAVKVFILSKTGNLQGTVPATP